MLMCLQENNFGAIGNQEVLCDDIKPLWLKNSYFVFAVILLIISRPEEAMGCSTDTVVIRLLI